MKNGYLCTSNPKLFPPPSLQTAGGKQKVNCAALKGIFRIIQSIPSSKAEPFKQWMAEVASQILLHHEEKFIPTLGKKFSQGGNKKPIISRSKNIPFSTLPNSTVIWLVFARIVNLTF